MSDPLPPPPPPPPLPSTSTSSSNAAAAANANANNAAAAIHANNLNVNRANLDNHHGNNVAAAAAAAATDPNAVVQKIVEELKSQGIFDQIRNECLAEVDTKPAYQNLRTRVEGSINRFLSKGNNAAANWKPTLNKNQLRNQLRKHIQEATYMDAGVERIVDQVVNPKILSVIEPEVEGIMYNVLGVEKPQEADLQNGNIFPDADASEKLSVISSEDIDMRSGEDSDAGNGAPPPPQPPLPPGPPTPTESLAGARPPSTMNDSQAGSSPGGLRLGDMSPLTPDRNAAREESGSSPTLHRGNVSPLTPPPPKEEPRLPASPRTPPLPPPALPPQPLYPQDPQEAPVMIQGEECIGAVQDAGADEDMSPVSDSDFPDVSPPAESSTTPGQGAPSPPKTPPLPPGFPPSHFANPPPPMPPSLAPPLPPPPLPTGAPGDLQQPPRRPPSPMTSLIGSSPDDMDMDQDDSDNTLPTPPGETSRSSRKQRDDFSDKKSISGPSDISDTDLPSQSENEQEPSGGSGNEGGGDSEALLEQGEALRAKLAAAVIEEEEEEPSDGEIRDDDDGSEPKESEKEKASPPPPTPPPPPPKVEEEPSDGEIRSGEEEEKPDDFQKKFNAIFESGKEEEEGVGVSPGDAADITSPISDNMSPLAMSKGSTTTPEPITPKRPSGASSSSDSDDDKKDDSAELVASKIDKKDDESEDQGNNGGAAGPSSQSNLEQKEPPPPPPEPGQDNSNDSNNVKSPGGGGDEKKDSSASTRSAKDSAASSNSGSSSSKHGHHSIDSKRRDSSSSSHRKSSSSHSSSSKHSHRHHSSSHQKERRKSSSSSSSSGRKDTTDKNGKDKDTADKNGKDKESAKDAKKREKEKERDRIEKEKLRVEKIERKIKEKSNMKSEKFTDFDMFAPKPPKPKTPLSRPPSSASSGSASPLNPFGSKTPPAWGSKTPPAFGLKTPPAFGNKLLPKESPTNSTKGSCSSTTSSSNNSPLAKFDKTSSFLSSDTKKLERRASQDHKQSVQQTPPTKERVHTPRKRTSEPKLEEIFGQNRPLERKVYPELPVPKDEGDKLKQHEDDIIETKRRLEEARQRRLEEKHRLDLEKKLARRSVSHDSEPKLKKVPKEKAPKPEKPAPVFSEKKKKKLTLEDLMDDESEVSDWSDIEAPSLKRKKRKGKLVLEDSSDEEIGDPSAKRQTRKLVQKAEADAILSTDPSTENFRFFDDESVEQLVRAKTDLDEYLEDNDCISVSSVCSGDLDDPNELIYLSDVEDAEELRDTLAKYGGNPKVNPNPPRWLHDRLADWGFVRKDVNIFFQNNHGVKRVITEKTFNDRIMKRRAQQSLTNCPIPAKRRLTNPDEAAVSPTKEEASAFVSTKDLERLQSPVKHELTPKEETLVEHIKSEGTVIKEKIPKKEEIDRNLKEEEEADFYGFGDSDLKGELSKITSLCGFEIDLKGNTFGMSNTMDSRVLDEIELEDDERSLFGNNDDDTTKMMVQISPELMGEIQKLTSDDEAGYLLPPSPVSNKSGSSSPGDYENLNDSSRVGQVAASAIKRGGRRSRVNAIQTPPVPTTSERSSRRRTANGALPAP